MAVKDYTANVASAIRPLLAAGEQLLAASPLVKDPGTTEDVSVADELKNLLDPTVLVGLGTYPGNALQSAVFGRAVTGAPDSLARRLHDCVDRSPAPKVAVTTERLLILELNVVPQATAGWRRWLGPSDQVARELSGVARTAILGAIPAPAGVLRRGRLLVGFADGSGCVLVCAPPSLADAIVRGIGAPRTDGTDTGGDPA